MWAIGAHPFELIFAVVRYFAGSIKSDSVLAIGFARLASGRCDIDLIVNGFPTLRNYRMASMVIEYRKRVLIILVSIRLHKI